jgi:hypothetical protein
VDATTGQKLLQSVRAYPRRNDSAGEDGLHVVASRIGKTR